MGGLLKGQWHIHAIDTGDQYRNAQEYRKRGKPFQHFVLVVADDAGEGIKGTAEDIGISVGGFKGL
jgi:hypothetical protein